MKQPSEQLTDFSDEIDTKRVNKAIAYASRLLSMQEYSQKMVREKLKSKGYFEQEIEQAVEFLLENNWLNDERFSESFIRSRVNRGQGKTRILFELGQKGIDSAQAEEYMDALDVSWQFICDQTTQRKLQSLSSERDLKTRQKLERFLRYRGFSSCEIRHSITKYFKQTGVSSGEYDE